MRERRRLLSFCETIIRILLTGVLKYKPMWLQKFISWPRIQLGNVWSWVSPFFLTDFTALVCQCEAAKCVLCASVCPKQISSHKDAFTLFIWSIFMQMSPQTFIFFSLSNATICVFACKYDYQKCVALFLRVDWLAEAAWWCHRALTIRNKTPFLWRLFDWQNSWQMKCFRWDGRRGRRSLPTNRRMTLVHWLCASAAALPAFSRAFLETCTSVIVWTPSDSLASTKTFSPPGALVSPGGRGIQPRLNIKDTGARRPSYWEQIYEVAKRWPREKYRRLNHNSLPQRQIISLCEA